MCLAIPARVLVIHENMGELDMAGNRLSVDLSMVPEVKLGDYVMVHAGFAMQIYDEDEALATLEILREYAGLVETEVE